MPSHEAQVLRRPGRYTRYCRDSFVALVIRSIERKRFIFSDYRLYGGGFCSLTMTMAAYFGMTSWLPQALAHVTGFSGMGNT